MRYRNVNFSLVPVILFFLLTVNGCAPTPWTTLIKDDRRQSIEQSYRRFSNSQNLCRSGWDADIVINWRTSLNDYALPAYLQTLPPSYFKLVIANPLGQPLKLLATDGVDYQYIDVMDRSSISGSIRSWAIRYDLPYTLISRSWPDWLQGRPDGGKRRLISDIRQDNEARGVWLSIADVEEEHVVEKNDMETDSDITYPVYEYLLVDPETGIVKEQIIVDELQKPRATIVYNEWLQAGTCLYPVDIELTDLPYGAYIHLQFSEIQQAELNPVDFRITVPPGFSRTMMP